MNYKKPIRLHRCSDLYVDVDILKDESCSFFFQFVQHQHITIHLVLHDISEKSTISSLDSFGYISNIVYGDNMIEVINGDIKKRNVAMHKQIVVAKIDDVTCEFLLVCIGEKQRYSTLEDLLRTYVGKQRTLQRIILLLMICCIIYFAVYFGYEDMLANWMSGGGVIATVFCLFPILLFLSCIAYGVYRRIFRIWDVLDWI